MLNAPDHGRQHHRDRRIVQPKALPIHAIVCNDLAAPVNANQQLVQPVMRMLPADLLAGNARYQKEALHRKRNLVAGLAYAEQAPKVAKVRQPMQLDASDAAVYNPCLSGRYL